MLWIPSSHILSFSLLKIPFIVSCTRLAALAQSPPPTPPPSQEEAAKYSDKPDTLGSNWAPKSVYLYKSIFWANALCESAVVLAEQFPSNLAGTVLSLLVHNSSYRSGGVRITSAWIAGCTLMACGGALRLLCYRTLGKFFTWTLAVKKDHALITEGPYSVVRHPSYVGTLMIGVGTGLCHVSPGSWYRECIGWDTLASKVFTAAWITWWTFVPALLMARVNREDEVLRKEFGAEWDAYAERTPYRLFPFVY